jgi:drug/metabolite transporter (DMT)-like permease
VTSSIGAREQSRPPSGDLLLLSVAVAGVSSSGPLIASMAVPALAVAFWRNALATLVLTPYAVLRHAAELRALPRRTWALTALSGALLALHFGTWIPSLFLTSVASSTALVATQAVWTAVLTRLLGHPVSRRAWAGMLLAFAGVVVVTGVDVTLSADHLAGDLLALAGGLCAAAYVLVGGHVRRGTSTTAYTLICYGTCAALLLVVCLAAGVPLAGWSGGDWAKLAAVTVAAQLLGHSVFNRVLRTTSPLLVSLAVLLEVPGAALLAAVFLDQVPPVATLPAVVLILGGIALVVTAPGAEQPAAVPVE